MPNSLLKAIPAKSHALFKLEVGNIIVELQCKLQHWIVLSSIVTTGWGFEVGRYFHVATAFCIDELDKVWHLPAPIIHDALP